jgi:hypothetical protein
MLLPRIFDQLNYVEARITNGYIHRAVKGGMHYGEKHIPPLLPFPNALFYCEIIYLVPAVFKINCSGISLANAVIA